ncbi:MAG: hypothetical protein ACI4M3_05655 [Acutalibacteraceae bacterium]
MMKGAIKQFWESWKADYNFKTFVTSALSLLIGIAFTIYNGFLGFYYSSIWNGSICVYYILLAVIRGILVVYQRKIYDMPDKSGSKHGRKIFYLTHIIMFLMNVSLIIPIIVMIKGDRTYNLGMIPAIAIATYTTYRIVMAIIHYSKSRKIDNVLIKELRTANLIDTLVAVLTLQNTMIIASEGEITEKMRTLSIVSSTAIWLVIVILSILSFRYALKSEY